MGAFWKCLNESVRLSIHTLGYIENWDFVGCKPSQKPKVFAPQSPFFRYSRKYGLGPSLGISADLTLGRPLIPVLVTIIWATSLNHAGRLAAPYSTARLAPFNRCSFVYGTRNTAIVRAQEGKPLCMRAHACPSRQLLCWLFRISNRQSIPCGMQIDNIEPFSQSPA
jgi:hypothetical protein